MNKACGWLFVVVGGLTGAIMAAQAASTDLANLRWKNRALVVVAPDGRDEKLIAQRRIVERNASGMADRDMVLIEAVGDNERARALRRQFSVAESRFKVVLLGKDGNTAISSDSPLGADRLFATIDAMPMRRDEMRRKGE